MRLTNMRTKRLETVSASGIQAVMPMDAGTVIIYKKTAEDKVRGLPRKFLRVIEKVDIVACQMVSEAKELA